MNMHKDKMRKTNKTYGNLIYNIIAKKNITILLQRIIGYKGDINLMLKKSVNTYKKKCKNHNSFYDCNIFNNRSNSFFYINQLMQLFKMGAS